MSTYEWWGWQPETDNENADDREGVYYLTIVRDGEEYATIIHRVLRCDGCGIEKFPLDGKVAHEKTRRAQHIVKALNGWEKAGNIVEAAAQIRSEREAGEPT